MSGGNLSDQIGTKVSDEQIGEYHFQGKDKKGKLEYFQSPLRNVVLVKHVALNVYPHFERIRLNE